MKQLFIVLLTVSLFFACGFTPKPVQKLPRPSLKGKISVEEAIQNRRSVRQYAPRDLSLAQISQLLWSAQGITEPTHKFRAAPSAGALYPVDLYLVTKNGIYTYRSDGHLIRPISDKDIREALAKACMNQSFINKAPLIIVLAGVYKRVETKYGEKGHSYTYIECGHIAQNVHLQAVAMGLGSVPISYFDTEQVHKILSIPSDREVVYLVPVGYPLK